MPRVRSQLAIQADPALLQRLRSHAETSGRTVTSLVLEGIEAVLSGRLGMAGPGKADPELLARIEVVELRLQQLEATPPALSASNTFVSRNNLVGKHS